MTEVWEVQCFSTRAPLVFQTGHSIVWGCPQRIAETLALMTCTSEVVVTSLARPEHTCPGEAVIPLVKNHHIL